MLEKQCPCGGKMYIDSYEHPKKSVEWLYRCVACGNFEPAIREDAVASYTESVISMYDKKVK